MIKKLKKKPVEEFYYSEIIVLTSATSLPNNEPFHSLFSKFLITIVECYIDPALRFQELFGRNGKNMLRGEYQKEGIKYKGE